MKVVDGMSNNVHLCTPSDSCEHAAQLMKKYDVGSIPVVESLASSKLVGTITDRDICLKLVGEAKPTNTLVADVMSTAVITCKSDDSLLTCETLMQQHQVRRIPVVDGQGRCVGIVAQADIALRDDAQNLKQTVSAISQPRDSHAKFAAARTKPAATIAAA